MAPTTYPDRLIVFSRPAWRAPNPYSRLLAEALGGQGIEVHELDRSFGRLPRRRAVLLFHWPDEFFFHQGVRRSLRAIVLAGEIWWGRRRHGHKLVWIAHNIIPHRREGRPFTLGRRLFLQLIDGVVLLSESSRQMLEEAYPQLRGRPKLVITHGSYAPVAVTPANVAAVVGARAIRLAFVGQVKRYKAPDLLARLVSSMPPSEATLAISGSCSEPALAAELEAVAERCDNVRLDLRFLDDAEIERAIDVSDVVVLPYRDVLNSGSALLSLSRGRPVIAPRLGSLLELRSQVGAEWVWLYDGTLDTAALRAGLRWVRETPRPALPDLSEHDWDKIGNKAAAFFQRLLAGRQPGS